MYGHYTALIVLRAEDERMWFLKNIFHHLCGSPLTFALIRCFLSRPIITILHPLSPVMHRNLHSSRKCGGEESVGYCFESYARALGKSVAPLIRFILSSVVTTELGGHFLPNEHDLDGMHFIFGMTVERSASGLAIATQKCLTFG